MNKFIVKLIMSAILGLIIGQLIGLSLDFPAYSRIVCGGYDYDIVTAEDGNKLRMCHSGSMCDYNYTTEKAYIVNSMDDLNLGDIVLYYNPAFKTHGITHRIIALNYELEQVLIKGDCNEYSDGWFNVSNVIYAIR